MKLKPGVRAMVTGAARGIGRATAEAIARRGCTVAMVDVDGRALHATADRLLTAGRHVSSHVADVGDRKRISDLAGEIEAMHGGLEVLVNNAGVALSGRFDEQRLDDLDWVMRVNFWGAVHCSAALLPLLRRAEQGMIVNVLSVHAIVGTPGKTAYCASKFALRGLSEALSAELQGSSVRVTRVFVGPVNTDLVRAGRAVSPAAREREAEFLAKKGVAAGDVAEAIVRAVDRGSRRVFIGGARILDLASRLFPGRTAGAVSSLARRLEIV